jgi:hypothetical protein
MSAERFERLDRARVVHQRCFVFNAINESRLILALHHGVIHGLVRKIGKVPDKLVVQ